jgi:hypothetical protein
LLAPRSLFPSYQYAAANPVNYADPLGLSPVGCGPYCGPDITSWFMDEVRLHLTYGVLIKAYRESARAAALWPGAEYGVDYRFPDPLHGLVKAVPFADSLIDSMDPLLRSVVVDELFLFEYALYGLSITYAGIDYDSLLGKVGDCSMTSCKLSSENNSMTLCDRCVDVSDLGNIIFGVGAYARGYGIHMATGAAYLFNASQEGWKTALSLPDPRGATVGWLLAGTGAYWGKGVFCALLKGLDPLGYRDAAEDASLCCPCEHEAPRLWHSRPSSFYDVFDVEQRGEHNSVIWFFNWLGDFFGEPPRKR